MSEYYLYPGTLLVVPDPCKVTTVLGSCIAVCLFDPVRRIGGINHFMLPFWNGEGLPTPRYGNVAIDTLVEQLQGFGCQKSNMKAKVFGGAAMWDSSTGLVSIGERNIELARRSLERHGIPVLAEDVGGNSSRKIVFFTGTGEVLLRRQKGVVRLERQSCDESAPIPVSGFGRQPASQGGVTSEAETSSFSRVMSRQRK